MGRPPVAELTAPADRGARPTSEVAGAERGLPAGPPAAGGVGDRSLAVLDVPDGGDGGDGLARQTGQLGQAEQLVQVTDQRHVADDRQRGRAAAAHRGDVARPCRPPRTGTGGSAGSTPPGFEPAAWREL